MKSLIYRFPSHAGRRLRVAFIAGLAAASAALWLQNAAAEPISESALAQISALRAEKESRTPAQQKIDSQLVYGLKQSRNQPIATGVPNLRLAIKQEADGRVWVDLKANITPDLLNLITNSGGTVLNSSPQFNSARILIPLSLIETLAARPDVQFVQAAVRMMTLTGSVDSEGDTTHNAILARNTFSVTGRGVKVGVLSDSVDFATQAQTTGDIPPDLVVLPGQSGIPNTGEGTAMLEIVYDLAPESSLYFATADGGPGNFAQNILNLRSAGCDVIIDDVKYFNESPFQDGIVAQAVNTVTASGALYFSSAGNEGNKKYGTSGTWEGDFLDGGAAGTPVNGKNGNLHSFGANTYNTAVQSGNSVVLLWSDPLGASTNDYDLYVLDTNGTAVVSSSTTTQNGSQDPFEIVPPANPGERIVVVKATGDPRFLHIDTIRGELEVNTDGNIIGHAATTNAFAVAAVDIHNAFPGAFVGGSANPVEAFTSDGPRRVFYNADGTPITPTNFLSTGGYVRPKPDIAAADGVSTTLPPFSGLNPFYGTSAAAPHAGAIAALLKSYNPQLDPATIRSILTGTALDNEGPGFDNNSGFGIVMADRALAAAPPPPPLPTLEIATNYISAGNGDGIIDYNECNNLDVVLTNVGRAVATGVRVTVSTATPGVAIAQSTSAYPNILTNGSGTNFFSFKVSTAPDFVCGLPIRLTFVIKCDQVTTTNRITLQSGTPGVPLRFDNPNALPIPDVGTATSTIVVSNIDFALSRVAVSLFLPHTFDSDLVIQLVGPDGTTSTLSRNEGLNGQNYGQQCSPDSLRTTFDDAAPTPISSGTPPFVGTFQPETPLGRFAGKTGTNVNGAWKLVVTDTARFDTGTLECWSLLITPSVCSTNGGGECPGSDLALGMVGQPEPAIIGSPLTYIISVTNNGPSSAKNVAVSQVLPDSVVFLSASTSQGSAAYAGGVVTASLGKMNARGVATITVVGLPTIAGIVSSSASVSSEQPDFDLSNNSATVLSHVNPPTADLAVGLMASPNVLSVGGTVTFSLSVTNNGPSPASGVTVTNIFPDGFVLLGESLSQGTLSVYGNTVVCSFGAVAKGDQATATITATAISSGTLIATASATANQIDPVAINNFVATPVTIGPAADLALTLTAIPNPVVLSSNLTFFTTVTNHGPSFATNVVVTESIPIGVNVVSTSTSQGNITFNGGNLVCNLGTLPQGGWATISVVVTTTKLGNLASTATASSPVADPNQANNSATVLGQVSTPFVNIVSAGAALTAESFSPPNGALDAGETVTVQFRLQNIGNIPNTNLIATLLPTGGVTSPSGPQVYGLIQPIGIPGGVYVSRPFTFTASGTNGGTVVATLQLQDGLNPLPPVTYTFPLQNVYSFANTNYITIPDIGIASNYPAVINVSGITGTVGKVTATLFGLSHTFPHDISALLVGPTGAKTLVLSHAAGGSTADNVTVTFDDTAPTPLSPGGSIVSGVWQPSAYPPSPVFSNPAPAGPYTAALSTFNAQNPNGLWSLYILDDSSGDSGFVAGGWGLSFTSITPVNQLADLGLSITANPDPVLSGDNLTYTFLITNAGPNGATGVTFTNAIPVGATLVSAVASQGNLVSSGNVIIGNLASLDANASATVTVVVRPTIISGQLTNSGSVGAFETDIRPVNNQAVVVSGVSLPSADVGVGILANASTVFVRSNLTYTVTITNNGPNNALDVIATAPLPASTVYVSGSASQGTVNVNNSSVVAALGALAPQAIARVTFALSPLASGSITNTVSVTTSSSDPVLANNSATAVALAVAPAPIIQTAGATLTAESFSPPNGAINPGETVTVALALTNAGIVDTANVVATLVPSGGVTAPSGPQAYGALKHGGPAVARPFTFTADPSATGAIVATLQLADGPNNLGAVAFTFNLPSTVSFANTNFILIPEQGAATPYPSVINISGVTGYVHTVTVTLHGLTHSFPRDVNVLLVNPAGASTLVQSHAGGGYGVTNVTLTFDDAASGPLPFNAQIFSGTNKPTQYGTTVSIPQPALVAPSGTTLSALTGVDPNGGWSLYVLDDSAGDSGYISGGWSLDLNTVSPVSPPADLGVSASVTPGSVFLGSSVLYTISVTNSGPALAPGVVVTDVLPASFSVASSSASQGTVSVAGSTVSFNLGSLDIGATATLTITAVPSLAGVFTNTVATSGAYTDLNPANDTAVVAISVSSPVPAVLSGSFVSGQFQLTVAAQPGQTYDVQASTNLTSWVSLGLYLAPFNGVFTVKDSSSSGLHTRYYRTVRQIR
jgi:uncharacterized repeat protein (TIGR01451 family)